MTWIWPGARRAAVALLLLARALTGFIPVLEACWTFCALIQDHQHAVQRWRRGTQQDEKPGGNMVAKIALEEHFLSPGYDEYWRPTVGNVDPQIAANIFARLTDFGEMRLKAMDEAGIARSVLAIAGPGVQSEPDAARALKN